MKKLGVALVVILGLLVVASPANAIHKGTVCKNFPGPDGAGGVHLQACAIVDDHDFEDWIRAVGKFRNFGSGPAAVHVSYLRLVSLNGVVRDTGSFVGTIASGNFIQAPTTWLKNPTGTFHSRIRMWVCWPGLPGDPCGNVAVWNSGSVTYP